MKKILITANVDWFLISHRLCIAEAALSAGWEVYVACEDTGRAQEIKDKKVNYIPLSFSRSGTNPFQEIFTIIKFYRIYKKLRPDIVHHVTLKPVIYGSFVARILKVKGVLNAVSGLGYAFTENRKGLVQKFMVKLMGYGYHRNNISFIFQNHDDYKELNALKVLYPENKIHFIKGSGVDLLKFKLEPFPKSSKTIILFPTRMLWDKGVAELRKATEILRNKYKNKVTFILSGLADEENKAGVSASYLNDWQDGTYVKWIGYQKNMVAIYRNSHIVVLPSYREGMPKTLIEACALGRPIVTTNAIGCRECVDEGLNGLKVPIKSSLELAQAIEKLILNEELRIKMGKESRKKAEAEFDQKDVILKHLKIYQSLYND